MLTKIEEYSTKRADIERITENIQMKSQKKMNMIDADLVKTLLVKNLKKRIFLIQLKENNEKIKMIK